MKKAATGALTAVAGVGFVLVTTLGIMFGATVADEGDSAQAAPGLAFGLNIKAMPAAGQRYADWYVKSAQAVAAECPGITPALLAAQGMQESRFNPTIEGPATQYGRAKGIAQFIDSTWATYGRDQDGDGDASAKDPEDAIMAQGRYMCSLYQRGTKSGYDEDPVALALAGYNAGWGWVQHYGGVPPESFAKGQTYNYVHTIMATAEKWSVAAGSANPSAAVRRAYTQLGIPYAYGGGTPNGPSTGMCIGGNGYRNGRCVAATTEGWDCSSLTQYAYWPSYQLPRVAADQYKATANRSVSRDGLKPGDLVFWTHGGADGIYHVALYYGNGKILHAPRTGKSVEIVDLKNAMPQADYFAATRPGE